MEITSLYTQKNLTYFGVTLLVLAGGGYYYYRYSKPKGNDKNLLEN